MPEYDFMNNVRGDIELLRKEMSAPGVEEMIREVAQRTGASEREALAALWRTSRRHGETLGVFVAELRDQFARETAATGT
jgi:hypothetical protein